jgi:hypothetical protein
MERSLILGFASIGMNAVLLIIVGERLGWPAFKDFMLHPATAGWIQAIGSIGAIAAAAWVVQRQHSLQEQSTQAENIGRRADAINGMTLVLMRQLNALLAYRRQILEPQRHNVARHFALPPTLPMKHSALQVEWTQFTYLIRTAAEQHLLQLILAHDTFHSAVDAINERNDLHRREFQPKLEASNLDLEEGVPDTEVAAAVGPRLTFMLQAGTDAAYELVDHAIHLLETVGRSAPQAFQPMYPNHQINGFGPVA